MEGFYEIRASRVLGDATLEDEVRAVAGRSGYLWVLLAPVVALLVRVPLTIGSAGLYGHDPYVHLYLVKQWLRLSTWSRLHAPTDVELIPSDYNSWPGAHILAGSLASFGLDPILVMDWLPVLLFLLLDLAVVLVLLRRTGLPLAVTGGLLFGLLDYILLMTMWYTPEVIGLALIGALLLNEATVRRPWVSLLLLVGILLTHHLSLLIAVALWAVMAPSRPGRAHIAVAALVGAGTLAFWELAMGATWSMPDIRSQLGGVPPALLVVAAMALLMLFKYGASLASERRGWTPWGSTVLELARERLGRLGAWGVAAAVLVAAAVVAAVYSPGLSRMDGIGIQPSKLLILAGAVMMVVKAPMDRRLARMLVAFGLLMLLFVLNPLLYDFLPLNVRFLEFLYIPGVVLLGAGALAISREDARRARAVLLSLLLVSPVLYADDVLRFTSEDSQRFSFSQGDLEFAEAVGGRTEPDAIVVTPFGLGSVIIGVSERATDTYPIRAALNGDGYWSALPHLVNLTVDGPVYLVHSKDAKLYIETEDDHPTHAQLERLDTSLTQLSPRFETVVEGGDHVLYRFR